MVAIRVDEERVTPLLLMRRTGGRVALAPGVLLDAGLSTAEPPVPGLLEQAARPDGDWMLEMLNGEGAPMRVLIAGGEDE